MSDILTKIQKELKNYFSYFKHENVLVISEDKSVLPFAYLIQDEDFPNIILLSLAVDYPISIVVADITLVANSVFPVSLSDPFFISSSGETYFGDEAYNRCDLEQMDLKDINPASKEMH